MFQRRRARILFSVLVLAALVLVTLDFRTGEEGPIDRVRAVATAALRPVQDGLAAVVRPIGDAAGSIGEVFRVRAENERLRAQIETLRERQRSSADLTRENRELRELLGMRDLGGLDTIAATTVGMAPSQFEWTVVLDVGEEHGVERGMPVINADGLVGRVHLVTARTSWVHLAIDPSFSSSARVARNGEIGVLSGRGGDPMVFQLFDPEADIEVGDEIVTNQYRGGSMPGGVPIGTVTSVAEDSPPLTRDVTVSPFVDFTRLHVLLVVEADPIDIAPPEDVDEPVFEPPDVAPRLDPEEGDDADPEEGDEEPGDDDDEPAGDQQAMARMLVAGRDNGAPR